MWLVLEQLTIFEFVNLIHNDRGSCWQQCRLKRKVCFNRILNLVRCKLMYYALMDILAFLIIVITNHDILLNGSQYCITQIHRSYRNFILSVIIYYVVDALWGFFDALAYSDLLFFDTQIYFVTMAVSILFWTRYVTTYLNNRNIFRMLLNYSGKLFVAVVTTLVLVNFYYPTIFEVQPNGDYHALTARYGILIFQIILLMLTSIYSLHLHKRSRSFLKVRYLIVGLSGLIMLFFIFAQIFDPLLPLYAMGFMVSCCLIRTLVVENEKEEYRNNLEIALRREQMHVIELNTAWKLAYTDVLTGSESNLAYSEKAEKVDLHIFRGELKELAVIVFDVNGLKQVNDNLGHDMGNEYIKNAYSTICKHFAHSPIYRIGGDEFVAILENDDYQNRENLLNQFNLEIENNLKENAVVVSAGIAEYNQEKDNSFKRIFKRADQHMYERKAKLKQLKND